jgi:2-isopropylmalate synthase
VASQGDFEAVQAIASAVEKCQVAGLCRAVPADIDRAWEAVKHAKKPRIHTFLATSPIHMKHKLGKEPDQVLKMAEAAVKHAAQYTENVEFSAEDASRSEPEFLAEICGVAIAAGATTINIPDTVGYAVPSEFSALIEHLLKQVKNADKAVFSVHCHNDLGLAVANTLAALRVGARQAEVTLSGIGERAGNAALEEVVMGIETRKPYYGLETGVDTTQLYPSCRLLSRIIGRPIPANKAVVGANAFAHESGVHQDGMFKNRQTYEIMTPESIGRKGTDMVLGKHSGKAAVKRKVEELGYRIDDDQVDQVTRAVKKLADWKKSIYDEDIEAIILEEVFRIPDKYGLKHMHVQAGNIDIPSTAAVVMFVDGEEKKLSTFGVGPVDALFNTICDIVGKRPTLQEYLVAAITGGTDAQGEVTVRIEEDGKTAVGRGSDGDIIVASAKAYINALNRLAKKTEEKSWPTL